MSRWAPLVAGVAFAGSVLFGVRLTPLLLRLIIQLPGTVVDWWSSLGSFEQSLAPVVFLGALAAIGPMRRWIKKMQWVKPTA